MARVWNFPSFQISGQIFYVPGAGLEGGITAGGSRIASPEPGGFSRLELQPSLAVFEWESPYASWIMSKTNGEVMKVRLAPTPQVCRSTGGTVTWDDDLLWSNQQAWSGDITAVYAAAALIGSNTLTVDVSEIGEIIKHGHVIGHDQFCYIVDDIEYVGTNAVITVKPPLRKAVAVSDIVLFRPYFTGTIVNGSEIIAMYDAANRGSIELPRIIFDEVIEYE